MLLTGAIVGLDECSRCKNEINHLRDVMWSLRYLSDKRLTGLGYKSKAKVVAGHIEPYLRSFHLKCNGELTFMLRDGVVWDRVVTCKDVELAES